MFFGLLNPRRCDVTVCGDGLFILNPGGLQPSLMDVMNVSSEPFGHAKQTPAGQLFFFSEANKINLSSNLKKQLKKTVS